MTGGGDCPGLNAAIRAVAKTAIYEYGLEVIGIEDAFQGGCRAPYEAAGGAGMFRGF